jgi:hypothetical protein
MDELSLTVDLIEERIVKGNLRWLANFSEIQRDFELEDLKIALYATGSLEEKGFLLSRLFSAVVTPKYKVRFLFCTAQEFNEAMLKKLTTIAQRKFGQDDWIFVALVQNEPINNSLKRTVENLENPRIGVVTYSLASNEEAFSNNVLGKGLKKQLRLTQARFEALDVPDYVKSFAVIFSFGILLLFILQLFFNVPLLNPTAMPVAILVLLFFSIAAGHSLYKSQYHVTLLLTKEGFSLKKGNSLTERKWSEFKNAVIYVTPRRETCIRLYGENQPFDLPISRVGLSRKEAYNSIRLLLG